MHRAIEDHVSAHWVDVAHDARLRVVEAGSGPAVVLIPGWTMGWTVFEHQIRVLARTRLVITLDPRGHGASTVTIDGNCYAQHGRDIETVVDALGIHRFALVGWSFGALACYAYLEQTGFDRVERLAILDQAPRPCASEHETTWCDGDWSSFQSDLLEPLAADRTSFADDFVEWMTSKPLRPADREWLTTMQASVPTAVAKALVTDAAFSDYTAVAEAADAVLPALQVVRTEDLDLAAPWLRAHTPRAQIESTASHLGFWESPRDFNEILLGFLGGRGDDSRTAGTSDARSEP